jgi:AcrR family transcriptional regulator
MSSEQTIERLVATATEEFQRHGYDGTDVNRIARRSGMSPNTFYRCFKDKLDIFIAVFRTWAARERLLMRVLLTLPAPDAELVATCVGHYREHLPFRRSLRQLALEEPRMRRARAADRIETLSEIRFWLGQPLADDGRMASDLMQLERLAEALAEGEFADMGLADGEARRDLAAILRRMRSAAARPANQPTNDPAPPDEALSA